MTDSTAIVRTLYTRVLGRDPQSDELAFWTEQCHDLSAVPRVITGFFESEEYQARQGTVPGHPPGHFYSPINDPSTLDSAKLEAARRNLRSLPGIELNLERQHELWEQFTQLPTQIVAEQSPSRRYYYHNGVYGPGDALVLSGMIGALRPKRIIEIGSGFSSACMLDARDDHALDCDLTFIEPYPDTLFWHLTDRDRESCRVIQSPVQSVDPEEFEKLGAGDFLFIDSTHVMKACSDVNCELFDILPRLKSGVVVHFHDIFWPFEYPTDWIVNRRYSWNELYGLRAFLMYNPKFSIMFFNDAFAILRAESVASAPDEPRTLFQANPGGGLWLETR